MTTFSRIVKDYRNAFKIFADYRCKSDFDFGKCTKSGRLPDYLR